jgi:hypothetical protein
MVACVSSGLCYRAENSLVPAGLLAAPIGNRFCDPSDSLSDLVDPEAEITSSESATPLLFNGL